MKTFYLHIGHPKTGTSYIQAALAQSVAQLKKHGINYPIHGASEAQGLTDKISSGNAQSVLQTRKSLQNWLSRHGNEEAVSLLASSEHLFKHLLTWIDGEDVDKSLQELENIAAEFGFKRIEILLFLREPVSLCESSWQQNIKRGGLTENLDWFTSSAGTVYLSIAAKITGALSKSSQIKLTLKNYDHEKKALLTPVESWLGIPPQTLTRPAAGKVNRSLTRAELELQRALNVLAGKRLILSDFFVNNLPDIHAEHFKLSADALTRLAAESVPFLDVVNAELPEVEKLFLSELSDSQVSAANDEADRFCFNRDQLEQIASFIYQTDESGEHARNQISEMKHELDQMKSEMKYTLDQMKVEQDELTDLRVRHAATQAALKRAWRDPIPHLFTAYAAKIRAGVNRKKRRS